MPPLAASSLADGVYVQLPKHIRSVGVQHLIAESWPKGRTGHMMRSL